LCSIRNPETIVTCQPNTLYTLGPEFGGYSLTWSISTVGRAGIMLGYAIAVTIRATVQTRVALVVAVMLLDFPLHGSLVSPFLIMLLIGVYGTALGLALSAFDRTECQAVQFMPRILLPQITLSGLLVPTDRLPGVLRWGSTVNPLRYSCYLLKEVMLTMALITDHSFTLSLVVLIAVAVLFTGATTMRRQQDG
jgi:ABC-2 type transport system permease protein